jgi:hypothetical protein
VKGFHGLSVFPFHVVMLHDIVREFKFSSWSMVLAAAFEGAS